MPALSAGLLDMTDRAEQRDEGKQCPRAHWGIIAQVACEAPADSYSCP